MSIESRHNFHCETIKTHVPALRVAHWEIYMGIAHWEFIESFALRDVQRTMTVDMGIVHWEFIKSSSSSSRAHRVHRELIEIIESFALRDAQWTTVDTITRTPLKHKASGHKTCKIIVHACYYLFQTKHLRRKYLWLIFNQERSSKVHSPKQHIQR